MKIFTSASELRLQARLVKQVKEQGGWALKMANRHQGGIPDVFMKIPSCIEGVFAECKIDNLNLTPLQRDTLQKMHRAKQYAGWIVFSKIEGKWCIFIGADPLAEKALLGVNCDFIRLENKQWPVYRIIRAIVFWTDACG